jgi:hypothetical protein
MPIAKPAKPKAAPISHHKGEARVWTQGRCEFSPLASDGLRGGRLKSIGAEPIVQLGRFALLAGAAGIR